MRNTKIRNGKQFPLEVKMATLNDIKSDPEVSFSKLAKERNMSTATVSLWARKAGLNRAIPPQLAAHQAHKAQEKQFNTPQVQADGTIMFRGKIYK